MSPASENAAQNPSMINGIDGYINVRPDDYTVTWETTDPISSPGSLRVQRFDGGDPCYIRITGSLLNPATVDDLSDPAYHQIPVTPGNVVAVSCAVSGDIPHLAVYSELYALDADGHQLPDPLVREEWGYGVYLEDPGYPLNDQLWYSGEVNYVGCTSLVPEGVTAVFWELILEDVSPDPTPLGTNVWVDNVCIDTNSDRTVATWEGTEYEGGNWEPLHPQVQPYNDHYVDGDMPGYEWTGTPGESASVSTDDSGEGGEGGGGVARLLMAEAEPPELDASYGHFRRIGLAEQYIDPADGLYKTRNSIRIAPSPGGTYYEEVDLGTPDIRDSIQDNPQADGVYDQTQYIGGRNVSITGVVIADDFGSKPEENNWDPNVEWNRISPAIARLSAWGNPALRFLLYFRDDAGIDRFMNVRGAGFTAPAVMPGRGQLRAWQLQLFNWTGKVYTFDSSPTASYDGRTVVRVRQEAGTLAGREYPELAPYLRDYPSAGVGSTYVIYQGSVPTGCLVRCYSGAAAMTAPRVRITGPDNIAMEVGISGITIPANYVVEYDTLNKTVSMHAIGSPIVSNLEQYLTAPLTWPTLRPGINYRADLANERAQGYNKIDYIVDTADVSAYADVLFWNASLLA